MLNRTQKKEVWMKELELVLLLFFFGWALLGERAETEQKRIKNKSNISVCRSCYDSTCLWLFLTITYTKQSNSLFVEVIRFLAKKFMEKTTMSSLRYYVKFFIHFIHIHDSNICYCFYDIKILLVRAHIKWLLFS